MGILHRSCSMQQDISDVFNIPWILQELLSRKQVFGGTVFLIFPIIYQIVDQNLALRSLLTGAWMPEISSFNWFGHKNEQLSQFAPKFQRDQTCFDIKLPTVMISFSIIPVFAF